MVARAMWRSEALVGGCALATSLHSPAAWAGSPTKAQPCVPLISTVLLQPFLIPLIIIGYGQVKNAVWYSVCHHPRKQDYTLQWKKPTLTMPKSEEILPAHVQL